MSNLQHHLENRVEAKFSDTKKELIKIAEKIDSSIPRNIKSNPIENLHEKFSETGKTLDSLTDELIDFSNKSLTDFEKEIENIQEPDKSLATDKYRDLLVNEMQTIIRELLRKRILE